MSDLIFFFYALSVLVYNLTRISYLFYLAFICAFYVCIHKYHKTRDDYYLVELVLWSITIPSNYVVLGSLFVIFILKIKSGKKGVKGINCLVFIPFFGYLVMNICINRIHVVNTLFYVLYFIPLVLCALLFQKFQLDQNGKEKIINLLKKLLVVQGVGIVSELLFNFKTVTSMIDFDWVVGTFGEFQGNMFFFFCAFCFVIFLEQYTKYHKDLFYLILSGIFMIMTGSIALIVFFAVSVLLYFFITLDIKTENRIKILTLLGLALIFFVLVTPAWIKSYMVRIYHADDKSVYISKISDYENVFLNPDNSMEFELFGAGIGEYSSRAALTCSGVYIDSYNSLFEPSMSKYTKEYIYDKLIYVYKHRLGTLDTPFSEFIAVKGELGWIGIIFLILYFFVTLKNNKEWSKIFVIFIVLSCFLENYLEFAKVVCLLYLLECYFKNESLKKDVLLLKGMIK